MGSGSRRCRTGRRKARCPATIVPLPAMLTTMLVVLRVEVVVSLSQTPAPLMLMMAPGYALNPPTHSLFAARLTSMSAP
jgi:hypothetical protein